MSRGVLLYAHNNTEIDYIKIACANALMIKKNLGVPVTLVTDSGTLGWANNSLTGSLLSRCFDSIILSDQDHSFKNSKLYSDTSNSAKRLPFYNANHWQALDHSPYDETLFIDVDYLIMSSELSKCWGSVNDVMVNHRIHSPADDSAPYSKNIDDLGIKLYWATVIYFRKSEMANHFFSIIKHVQENYNYYRDMYYFPNGMFRNDHAVSIAIHMLNGYSGIRTIIPELPISGLLMSWDTDDIYKINGINDITIFAEKKTEKGAYLLTRFKDTDIHLMNKWAINRHSSELIDLYYD
jgi:hypothetical protein